MILSEQVLFAITLVGNGALLFLLVYFMITLSDLECDYLNAMECCSKLNRWVGPKMWTHAAIGGLLALHGCWWLALAATPMLAWLAYERTSVPASDLGVYDPAEIHNRDRLGKHVKNVIVYMLYYLLFFFVYLYCLIIALLKGDPLQRHHDDSIVTEL